LLKIIHFINKKQGFINQLLTALAISLIIALPSLISYTDDFNRLLKLWSYRDASLVLISFFVTGSLFLFFLLGLKKLNINKQIKSSLFLALVFICVWPLIDRIELHRFLKILIFIIGLVSVFYKSNIIEKYVRKSLLFFSPSVIIILFNLFLYPPATFMTGSLTNLKPSSKNQGRIYIFLFDGWSYLRTLEIVA